MKWIGTQLPLPLFQPLQPFVWHTSEPDGKLRVKIIKSPGTGVTRDIILKRIKEQL